MKAEEERKEEVLSLLRNPKEWNIFIYRQPIDKFNQRYNTRPGKVRRFSADEISLYINSFV